MRPEVAKARLPLGSQVWRDGPSFRRERRKLSRIVQWMEHRYRRMNRRAWLFPIQSTAPERN